MLPTLSVHLKHDFHHEFDRHYHYHYFHCHHHLNVQLMFERFRPLSDIQPLLQVSQCDKDFPVDDSQDQKGEQSWKKKMATGKILWPFWINFTSGRHIRIHINYHYWTCDKSPEESVVISCVTLISPQPGWHVDCSAWEQVIFEGFLKQSVLGKLIGFERLPQSTEDGYRHCPH